MADGWKMQFIQNRGKTSEGILMSRVLGSSNETKGFSKPEQR